jgi:transcriptional regulator with XRE-family HTH domain
MNESLRRALLRARLTEEDVAVRLEVDPKTVRRWLEGRAPYPRHRWLLAAVLGLDETDLWPQFGGSRSRPQEVQAVYPHLKDLSRETWLRLFARAQERIDILAGSAFFIVTDPQVMAVLADRAAEGVKERICLRDPNKIRIWPHDSLDTSTGQIAGALNQFGSLRHGGDVEVRVHDKAFTNFIYRSDDECLVTQNIYGVSPLRAPVIHLHRTKDEDLFDSYLGSFEDRWTGAYWP